MSGVVVHLFGGLGNQLFQYAAALQESEQRGGGLPVVVRSSQRWGEGHPQVDDLLGPLETASGLRFDIVRTGFRALPLELPHVPTSAMRSVMAGMMGVHRVGAAGAFDQRGSCVSDLHRDRRVVVDGYFQHPSWHTSSVVHVTRAIASRMPAVVVQMWSSLSESPAVIAVRGSDYARLGWVLPLSYYKQAMTELSRLGVTTVCIYSDDQRRGLEVAASFKENGFSVVHNPLAGATDMAGLDDFWCLALGRHVVMANSTFGWWAVTVGNHIAARTAVPRQYWAPTPWLPGTEFPCEVPRWICIAHDGFQGR
jgi:hypothetical protein